MKRTLVALFAFSAAAFAADGPAFDVASIKICGPGARQSDRVIGAPGTATAKPGRYRPPRLLMASMVQDAFHVLLDQIVGPSWIRDVKNPIGYCLEATMPPATTEEEFRKMYVRLLVDRFHLKYHMEKRNFPGYEMVVDEGGPKFKEVTPDPNPMSEDELERGKFKTGKDGFRIVRGPYIAGMLQNGRKHAKYQERSMEELAYWLGFDLGQAQGQTTLTGVPLPRVVDRTGLKGKYTFYLDYSSPAPSRPGEPPQYPGDKVIVNALRGQLGLKLNKTAAVPLDVVVVDSVDQMPTEN